MIPGRALDVGSVNSCVIIRGAAEPVQDALYRQLSDFLAGQCTLEQEATSSRSAVYIQRTGRRKLVDEAGLLASMRRIVSEFSAKLVVIDLDSLMRETDSLCQLIRILSASSLLIGTHGAGYITFSIHHEFNPIK